jgi:hypothetical protein
VAEQAAAIEERERLGGEADAAAAERQHLR